jgi:hypothetical protein
MRKIIPLAGIIVLAAIAVLWSKSISSRAQTATPVEQTQAPATLSPLDLMIKRGNTLPVEHAIEPF